MYWLVLFLLGFTVYDNFTFYNINKNPKQLIVNYYNYYYYYYITTLIIYFTTISNEYTNSYKIIKFFKILLSILACFSIFVILMSNNSIAGM